MPRQQPSYRRAAVAPLGRHKDEVVDGRGRTLTVQDEPHLFGIAGGGRLAARLMLRLSAGSAMVTGMDSRWEASLLEAIARLRPLRVDWMLVGSAGTAVHGAQIQPVDIDILLRRADDVASVAQSMPNRVDPSPSSDPEEWLSTAHQPVLRFGTENDRWTFGRWVLAGMVVEVAHIAASGAEGLLIETLGEQVWRVRTWVVWRGQRLPVVPLEVQLASMVARGQDERLARAISSRAPTRLNRLLLRRALDDRKIAPDRVPQIITDLIPER